MLPEYDATGVEPSGGGQGKLLPKQWFTFEVISFVSKAMDEYPLDGKTKNGDPKVDVLTEVVDEGEWKGHRVFHTVTFLPKGKDGAGMSIHWLKTIGQPYEGKFKPDSRAWVGSRARGYAIEDEYMGKKKNKWGEIKPLDETQAAMNAQTPAKKDDLPF